MTRHLLTRDHITYALDRALAPALEVDPGDEVVLETWDARTGTIRLDGDLLDHPHPVGTNPATGPIQVRGADPGMVLAVHLISIELAPEGFIAVKAGQGLLAHLAPDYATRIVAVRDGWAGWGGKVRFPVRPMVGVIGTAPAAAPLSTGLPGVHGGNMDNRMIAPGATVYLPVAVPGAGLGLGDVHGAMGDGEITFLALEICARVHIRIDVLPPPGPAGYRGRALVETPTAWVTTAEDLDMAAAVRQAADEAVFLLQQRLGLSFAEAYMLASAAVDVQICQCCQPGVFPVTARGVVSKAIDG